MKKDVLGHFTLNRDAIATNRGFYFQFLNLLKLWVENFISGKETLLYSEVGDDIKEVGDRIVFSQVKCYTSSFSLNSKAVKSALFSFYLNYLQEADNLPLKFVFLTNTSVRKAEKLLESWIAEQPIREGELKEKCIRRVGSILSDELGRSLRSKLSSGSISQENRQRFKDAHVQLENSILENARKFTESISWRFSSLTPEQAVADLVAKIMTLLTNPAFEGRSAVLLMDVLLSEIYRRSQRTIDSDRLLDKRLLLDLLEKTDSELELVVDRRIVVLFQGEIKLFKKELGRLKLRQDFQEKRIGILEEKAVFLSYPKQLSYLPPLPNANEIIARPALIAEMGRWFDSSLHLNIVGAGGNGKSTLAKLFIQRHYEEFDHICWLDAGQGVLKAMVVDELLSLNLGVQLGDKKGELAQFLQKLGNVQGNNIIVLDNLQTDEACFRQLAGLNNWKILSTSRTRNKVSGNIFLNGFASDEAKELFEKYAVIEGGEENILAEFFEYIEFNPLMIELSAKTIANSIDLTLAKFFSYLKQQQLDDVELKIDVEHQDSIENIQVFSFLQATFAVSGLSDEEQWLVEFFSILPSKEILITDLIDMAGSPYKSQNKGYFLNHIIKLEQKGWLERNGDRFSMHRLIQQNTIYTLRKKKAFIGFAFFITWLTARFVEAHRSNPASSLRFLRYGDSILEAIKEPYRKNLYQPLLMLENEVLLLHMTFISEVEVMERWQGLSERSAAYLGNMEPLLGTIFSNYGLCLMHHGRNEEAKSYWLKAKAIFLENGKATAGHLLSCLLNLSMAYMYLSEESSIREVMLEISSVRKQYAMGNDASVILQGNALAVANDDSDNHEAAAKIYELIIRVYKELPESQRNAIHYSSVLCNYTLNLVSRDLFEKAVKVGKHGLEFMQAHNLEKLPAFGNHVNVLYSLYLHLELDREADLMKKRYGFKV